MKTTATASTAYAILILTLANITLSSGQTASTSTGGTPDQRIEVPLEVGRIRLTKDSDGFAKFEGVRLSGKTGQPWLPRICIRLLMPPDVDFSTVQASVVETVVKEIEGEWQVRPAPPVATLGGKIVWPSGARIVDGRDAEIFEKNAFFPESFVSQIANQKMRDWRITEVAVDPYRYNPATRRLLCLTQGKLQVSYRRGVPKQVALSKSPVATQIQEDIRRQVSNYETMIREYITNK